MRKLTLIFIFSVSLACFTAGSAGAQSQQEAHDLKMEWWRDAKFGMFIHWGPYSIFGGVYNGHNQARGGAEWIMNRCKIPVAEYRQVASTFNPVDYDADRWVRLAKQAGMKYIVITSKHHDGFAMFKSDASAFNIVDFTPYGRDVIAELAEACRRHGLKLGFYYSQAQDWNNPGGTVARKEMREGWPNPDSTRIDAYTAAHQGYWDPAQQTATMEEYITNVSLPQVRELLSNYGDVAVIWWDTPTRMTDEFAEMFQEELSKYPQIITNDRLKRPNFPGDYKTPEGLVPKAEDIEGVDWETCMNIGSSWGFKSWEANWKSPETLIRNLVTIAARGGNYLLNVGPTPEGVIPQESVERLEAIGRWMDVNGEAIYNSQRSLMLPEWGQITRRDNPENTTLYLCVFDWPEDGKLEVETGYTARSASMLHDGSALTVVNGPGTVTVNVPAQMHDPVATVIKLELTGKMPKLDIVSNTTKTFDILDEL